MQAGLWNLKKYSTVGGGVSDIYRPDHAWRAGRNGDYIPIIAYSSRLKLFHKSAFAI